MKSLPEALADWTDFDVAEDAVAHALGIVAGPSFDEHGTWGDRKGMYWSANKVEAGLCRILQHMVAIGCVERDEDEHRYRWVAGFDAEKASLS